MDRDHLLSRLLVRGELSNYKLYPSGHHYFSLKDGEGAIRCVLFRGNAAGLRFRHPRTGEMVELSCGLPPEFQEQLRKLSAPVPREGG